MRPNNVEDIYPLTPMQQLMLMHSNNVTGSSVLSNQFLYRLTGPIDPERFEQCLHAIQKRHEALRTFFLWKDLREPMQLVHSGPKLPFTFVCLADMQAHDRISALEQIISTDRLLRFDLTRPALSRFTLVRQEPDCHHLIWSRHHLILDRWCVDILFDELFALYDAPGDVNAAVLSPCGRFRNYVGWLHGQDRALAHDYWHKALAGLVSPSLLFATDRDRTPYSEQGLPVVEREIEASLNEAMQSLARTHAVSLAVVMQAALALLCARRAGNDEAMFGLTVSGRPGDLHMVESTMGSFINNVPARIPIHNHLRLADWFHEIQVAQAQRNRYDYLSLSDIARQSTVSPSLPMFDVLALLHAPSVERRRGSCFEVEQIEGPLDSAHPFTLSLAESMGALRLAAVYDPACLTGEHARALLGELHTIFSDFVRMPEAFVSEFRGPDLTPSRVTDIVSEPMQGAADLAAAPDATALDGDAAVIAAIWNRTLGIDAIGLDDDFFALGGTSLQAVAASSEIEERLERPLPMSILLETGSIRSLLSKLDERQPQARTLVRIQPRGTRPPLFVVPGIGGDPVAVVHFARALGSSQPFYGFQSTGLDGHERPLTRIDEIATAHVKEMTGLVSGPFVICGVCWGALVALEMARQLSAMGRNPDLLVVVDPTHQSGSVVAAARKDPRFAIVRFMVKRLKLYWSEIRTTPPGERWRWFANKASFLGSKMVHTDALAGNRSEINRERVKAANLKALMGYTPTRYDGLVHAVLTADRGDFGPTDPRLEWLQRIAPGSEISYLPGTDTIDLLHGSNVAGLAGEMRAAIDVALR